MEVRMDANLSHTWGIPMFVAFLDILGFSAAMEHSYPPPDSYSQSANAGDLAFGLWCNCLPSRLKLRHNPRLDFVQLSDSLVIYGLNAEEVLTLACESFGTALVYGVPVRGGLGYGIINHAENKERPGTILNFYGAGLIDAYKSEQARGLGMRLLLSQKFKEASGISGRAFEHEGRSLEEFPWWTRSDVEVEHFRERVDSWWTVKKVGQWFKEPHRTDTVSVFKTALTELG